MYCKNRGNKLEEYEKFCGKCGQKVNDEIIKNGFDNKKEPLKIKFTHLMIVIGIVIIVAGVAISMNISSNDGLMQKAKNASDNYNNGSIPQQSTNTKSNQENKEYYDFIDSNYLTFNITEEELMEKILSGSSYSSKGYMKSAHSSEKNTMNYSKVVQGGVEIFQITTDPKNYKVKSFKLAFISNNTLTQEEAKQTYNNYSMVGIFALLGINANTTSRDEIDKGLKIVDDMSAGISIKKGLSLTINTEAKQIECLFSVTQ